MSDSSIKSCPKFDCIEPELEQVEKLLEQCLLDTDTQLKPILDDYSPKGGKMLRPKMVLLASKALGQINENHIRIAAILQMLHNATLLHDDVIDGGKVRRGRPTINAKWSNAAAVLLGDFLISKMFTLCTDFPGEVTAILADVTSRICQGELAQSLRDDSGKITQDEYLKIIENKTASLFQCCCLLGAKLSEASKEDTDAAAQFGLNWGMAFQIADDLSDITANENDTGKTAGRDAAGAKLTLPVIHYVENVGNNNHDNLQQLLADKHRLKQTLMAAGSIGYAQDTATKYIHRAQQNIGLLPKNDYTTCLNQFGDFIIDQIKLL